MAIDVQFLYKNLVDPNKTYDSPDEFFDSTYTGTVDEDDVKRHKEVNSKYVAEQTGVLTPDKKAVVMVKRFDTSLHYKEWKKERNLIPNIDFNLSEEEGFFINIPIWGEYNTKKKLEEFN